MRLITDGGGAESGGTIDEVEVAGDSGLVRSISDQENVPHLLRNDDLLLVDTLLDVDDEGLIAGERNSGDGFANGLELAAAVLCNDDVGLNLAGDEQSPTGVGNPVGDLASLEELAVEDVANVVLLEYP